MRIVFVGAVQFSLVCLREVLARGGDIVAVVTVAPDIQKRHADFADLAPDAAARGIPVIRTRNINNDETISRVRDLRPDIIFVFGFSQLIGPELLALAPAGCVGTHPAMLPLNRGRHPLIWALIEDLKESGLTFFFLDEGADSGDILWQRTFPITDTDDAGTLYRKIQALAIEGIQEFLPRLQAGTVVRISQDHSKATYWRKRTEADGEVQWQGPSRSAWNLVRALTRPYVGAHTWVGGRRLIIWKSKMDSSTEIARAGEILSVCDDEFVVKTGDGALRATEYEVENGDAWTPRAGEILGR